MTTKTNIQYSYAQDESGKIVHINDVPLKYAERGHYYSIDEGDAMIARKGNKVAWHFAHKDGRPGAQIGTKYYGKCPDLCINGIFYEHEGYIVNNPKANFSNILHSGLKQSNRIIIEKCGLSERIMKKSIRDRIKAGVPIEEIWVHEESQVVLLFKNTEGQ